MALRVPGSLSADAFGLGLLLFLQGGLGGSLEDPEKCLHLIVRGAGGGAPAPGRGKDRSQVGFRHLELRLQLLHPFEQLGCPLFRLDSGGSVLLGLAAKVFCTGDRFAGLPSQLDHALHDGAAQVGVRGSAVAGGGLGSKASFSPAPPPPRGPRDGLRLSCLERPSLEQPVAPILDLQAAPGSQCPYCPGYSKWIG